MDENNTTRRLKSFTALPNLFFIITLCVILLFEMGRYGVRPFTFGVVIGWLFLPLLGIIYYNSVTHDTNQDRWGVMILTGIFFALWIAGRLLG